VRGGDAWVAGVSRNHEKLFASTSHGRWTNKISGLPSYSDRSHYSHSHYLAVADQLLHTSLTQMLPPPEKERVAYQLEPRRERQLSVLEHCLQLVGRDVFGILHLVGVLVDVDRGTDEEDVVDYVHCQPSSAPELASPRMAPRGSRPASREAWGKDVCILSCSPHLPSLGAR
jgi:hypothetical protein